MLLEHAFATVRNLPAEDQDRLAGLLLQLAGEEQPTIVLGQTEAASLEESSGQALRGERASADQVRAVWAKHGL